MNNFSRIVVTGANGFIGQRLCRKLVEQGLRVHALLRSDQKLEPFASKLLQCQVIESMDGTTDWSYVLKKDDAVIHLAGCAHVNLGKNSEFLSQIQQVNVAGTKQLAASAVQLGVKRMVYLSSIKVYGEQSPLLPHKHWHKFTEQDNPQPGDAYASSKWQAEQELQQIAANSALETVILRSPLVYGKEAKANFQKLLRLIQSGLPLPLASIKNSRSLIYVDNLTDAILTTLNANTAVGKTYNVSDTETPSTPELIRKIAHALGKPARLFSCPQFFLRSLGKGLGKSATLMRLLETLVVDCEKIKRELNWKPPYTLQQALQRDFAP